MNVQKEIPFRKEKRCADVGTYIHTYTYVHTNFAVYLPDKLTRQLWSLIREFLRRLNDRPNRLKEAAGSSLHGSCFL